MVDILTSVMAAAGQRRARAGEAIFTTTGDTTFVVPAGVYSISAVAVGGGASGHPAYSAALNSNSGDGGDGGQGGSLSYFTSISVTPGEVLDITVGAGGAYYAPTTSTAFNNPGGHSIISRSGTNLLFARGGDNSSGNIVVGTYNGRGGSGGQEGTAVTYGHSGGGGGGGAGGYGTIAAVNTTTAQEYTSGGSGGNAGTGGFAGSGVTAHGAGGGGGGGGASYIANNLAGHQWSAGRYGGGVGIFGRGTSGAGGENGTNTHNDTQGTVGGDGSGFNYGRGGAGGVFKGYFVPSDGEVSYAYASGGGAGNNGAIRIIWGSGRAYPETDTAQEFSDEIYINGVLQ